MGGRYRRCSINFDWKRGEYALYKSVSSDDDKNHIVLRKVFVLQKIMTLLVIFKEVISKNVTIGCYFRQMVRSGLQPINQSKTGLLPKQVNSF